MGCRQSAEEQSRALETARTVALHYAGTLQDFICTETIERSSTSPKEGNWNEDHR
jgi:hypothetical protein